MSLPLRAILLTICPASFRDGPEDQTRNLEIPGSLALLAPRNDGGARYRTSAQLLISDDQVFSICLTTESGIGM